MVTPLTQKYFNFGELENSVMYCVCGVEVIAGFLFVHWLSRRAVERVVLAVGLAICNVSSVWCLVFMPNPIGPSLRHHTAAPHKPHPSPCTQPRPPPPCTHTLPLPSHNPTLPPRNPAVSLHTLTLLIYFGM